MKLLQHTRIFIFTLLVSSITTQLFGQQLLVNGDMELWISGCPFNTAPDNWNNYSTSLGPDQAGSCAGTLAAHQGLSYMNLVWTNAGLREGASQIVTGLVIGVDYKITFWANNSKGLYAQPGSGKIDVFLDQSTVFTTPEMASGDAWTEYTVDFTATASSHVLAFRVNAGSSNTSGSMGIDQVFLGPAVGIRDGMMHSMRVYPNPAQDIIMIEQGDYINDSEWTTEFQILNVQGQNIRQGIASFSNGNSSLDISDLRPGVYFLRINHELAPQYFKLIVE